MFVNKRGQVEEETLNKIAVIILALCAFYVIIRIIMSIMKTILAN